MARSLDYARAHPDEARAIIPTYLPDFHAAFGPTYEDPAILQWLLDQKKGNEG